MRGCDDDDGLVRIAAGKNRFASGRRGGTETEMIPRLHSPTERIRHGTLWSAFLLAGVHVGLLNAALRYCFKSNS